MVPSGPGPWTATVDYGDGSGAVPLVVSSGNGFSLDHVYASPGTYSVAIRVRYASGAEALGTLRVEVAAPWVTIAPVGISKGKKGTTSLGLVFSGNVDPATAGDRTRYRLVSAGRDKKFGTKDDRVVKLSSVVYDAGRHAVAITTKGRLPSGIKTFRLSSSSGSLRDTLGRPLDGDRDGPSGGDFLALVSKRSLTVTAASALRRAPGTRE